MQGRDLTRGPVPRLLLGLSLPVLASFVLQSLYALADLFFVGFLGGPALAGVGISLNSFFLVLALSQTMGAGALALISQAYGRQDLEGVRTAFQQAFWMMIALGLALWGLGWTLAEAYVNFFTTDPEVRREGLAFFRVYAATFFLQTFLIGTGSCWRAIGSFLWPTVMMGLNVLLNTALDPLLIFGLGPVPALGVAGAAWATVIAQALASAVFFWLILFERRNALLRVRWPFRLDFAVQGRILRIGLPSGAQFILTMAGLALTFRAVRPFGAEASAAVGVGFRVLQTALYPPLSVAAAAASLVGQNTGARIASRVRQTLAWAVGAAVAICLVEWAVLAVAPRFWMSFFAVDPAIVSLGASYLLINGGGNAFIAFGVVLTFCSQAMGRTVPPLLAALSRVASYAAMLLIWDRLVGLEPVTVFWCAVLSLVLESLALSAILASLVRITRGWGATSRPAQPA
jgi:putative MATE family efflux protein